MWCCLPARSATLNQPWCISSDVGRTLLSVKKCHITDNLTETTHTHAINQYHIIIHNYHPTLYLNNKSILLFFDHFWHCHDGTTIYDSYGIRINSSRRAIATVPSALHSVILFIIYAFGMPKRIILDSSSARIYRVQSLVTSTVRAPDGIRLKSSSAVPKYYSILVTSLVDYPAIRLLWLHSWVLMNECECVLPFGATALERP